VTRLLRLRLARFVRFGLLVLATAAAGCRGGAGGYGAPDDAGLEAPRFTDLELAALRNDFGDLPPEPPLDASNAHGADEAAAILGRKLFFETRYTKGNSVSCATCHIPEAGFQDNRDNTSKGVDFTARHTPSLVNAAYGAGASGVVWQFWDGRSDSLWSQALGPPENPVEMGSTRTKVALLVYDKYRKEYESIFTADSPMPSLRDSSTSASLVSDEASPNGTEPGKAAWQDLGVRDQALQTAITRIYVNFGKAIAAYEARLVSRDSRFDRFRNALVEGFAGSSHLSAEEIEGLKIFVGEGGCTSCHRGPNLTDGKFHNVGVPQTGEHVLPVDNGRADGIAKVKRDEFNCESTWSDQPDKAHCATRELAENPRETQEALGAFKTPSLRGVTSTAPYFHTGALRTLPQVIDFYDQGGGQSGYVGVLDSNIGELHLSNIEKQRLLDFLGALDGESLAVELLSPPKLPD
jgi:cytochrome c peroxidase